MADITCAWCAEPWDVYGLRHDGWEYLGSTPNLGASATDLLASANAGHEKDRHTLNTAVYKGVLKGRGCPDCGFKHKGEGPHRETQLRELVVDGVTDDDPMEFM